ncbi:hypothetical protein [Aquimarina algicola]|uniref:Lipoprotein n=1 Tax=Aquimarina algicola TaxID=2589995 RepID=A0A504J3P5_9FLAO|nr:hypothetical protein [Aquimarina algicola]TPN81709.1 hypothetical protein FHK87_24225 [Aquimarina algicola]
MVLRILLTLFVALAVIGCQNETKNDPFEITKNRIGLLTHTTQVKQLDSIFANDSILKTTADTQSISATNQIEIYEKGGDKLLILEVKKESDPTSTIQTIQVIDSRYKTTSGLSPDGVFKDIKDHYTVSKINNTLSTAVIFVDSIQAYFTIDKKELPTEFQNNTDKKITNTDIPDSAKIKNFWISWDLEE